eukprot:51398-Eustigmatos_ZCMA.PRE.1
MEWLHRAVAQGHTFAQFELARCLISGDGIKADMISGMRLLQEGVRRCRARYLFCDDVIEEDSIDAQSTLATCLLR